MGYADYAKALRYGQKAFRNSIENDQYPYLPVLDEILSHTDVEYEVFLGTEYIPLDQVVGTSTAGRTQAFASNFMPLLEENSEFATKWANLSIAQEEKGIRDAIKVYEYMNNYYVVEGNKRVSVLKYYGAPTIRADVTRKVPKRSDDLANRIYYEYMDFYKLTKINFLKFTKLGSFQKLLTVTGKNSTDEWTEDEYKDFAYVYSEFEKLFMEKGGESLPITCADALLYFLTLYPYDEVKDMLVPELKKRLDKIWPEILLSGEDESVDLQLDPKADKKPGTMNAMLQKIKPARKIRKVAFVYDKDPSTSDWIYGHELGRIHLQNIHGASIETKAFIVNSAEAEEQLEAICTEGFELIFAVTPQLIKACLKAAIAHPEVTVLNCALNSSHNAVRTYYTRMYEAKLLTGMIAGAMSTNDKIGYVADYPIYGAAASINAFAMGARMVNPRAKVYLAWSTLKDFDVDAYFKEENVTYISSQDMITPQNDNRQYGLYEETPEGKTNLAMSIYQWGAFYEKLYSSINSGSFKTEEAGESKAINYWWGLSAGVIDVIYSNNLPIGTKRLIETMKKTLSSGLFQPFTGPITDQNGVIHDKEAVGIKPEGIMTMDWLTDNVVGFIPSIDDLKEEAQPVVELRGLYTTTTEKGGASLL